MPFEALGVSLTLAVIAGCIAGGMIAWLIARRTRASALAEASLRFEVSRSQLAERVAAAEQRLHEAQRQLDAAAAKVEESDAALMQLTGQREALTAELRCERELSNKNFAVLERTRDELAQAFSALSARALKSNNETFLELARETLGKFHDAARADLGERQRAIAEVVQPVRASLDKFDAKVQEIEKSRVGAYESLREQVRSLAEGQGQLRSETANLVKALRQPNVRGRWGEMQLRRVVEMAGMLDRCDYVEQAAVDTVDGRLRPDLVVRLAGGKNIVVDAKTPLAAYLEAQEAPNDELRRAHLTDHARQLRAHIAALSRKSYWEQFQPSPEFVVLFVPGEPLWSAALEQDPALIEFGAEQRVLPATPLSLIAMLRAVAYGWRQEALAENARQISALGAELYQRLVTLGTHWNALGKSLAGAVKSYNDAMGSFETRVLVSARRFRDLQAVHGDAQLEPLPPIELSPRDPRVEERVPPLNCAP